MKSKLNITKRTRRLSTIVNPFMCLVFLVIVSCQKVSFEQDNMKLASSSSSKTNDNGKVKDVDGNTYNTVMIGNQVWMAQNLRTTRFNDKTDIPVAGPAALLENISTPVYCWYNDDITNKETYGAMYNWYAANSGKLCPTGWHVPSDMEWNTLTDYYGGLTVAGSSLKEAGNSHWATGNADATNVSGFTALPGGNRGDSYASLGAAGYWWTSTQSTDYPWAGWHRNMYSWDGTVGRYESNKYFAWSVRCIKDNISITENITGNATKWFGGDNRPESYLRNVGTGQSFTLNTSKNITAVSVWFNRYFDFDYAPESISHAVNIRLQLRNSAGVIITSADKYLDASFNGGWVRIEWLKKIKIAANQEYILTWYLIDGENLKLNTGSFGDLNDGYLSGRGFSAEIIPGQDIDSWSSWGEHPWDFCFKIHGD
jgi:uncharacterized protein (TIGR02145 family)